MKTCKFYTFTNIGFFFVIINVALSKIISTINIRTHWYAPVFWYFDKPINSDQLPFETPIPIGWMANCVHSDQIADLGSNVIWVCTVWSCVNMHILRTWWIQNLVESSKAILLPTLHSLYVYKHGRGMLMARFPHCIILTVIQILCIYFKHYTSDVHKGLFNVYKYACEYAWVESQITLYFGFSNYCDIWSNHRTNWPANIMSVVRMFFNKLLLQVCTSERVCLTCESLKVNSLFNSLKSRLT